MESLSFGEFSSGIHNRVSIRRIPMDGTIEVTWRCPQKCVHCYNNLPLEDAFAGQGEMSLEEHCRILDEITEAGCLWLLYTGGEIFARHDFLEIYTYAKKKGLLITLFTNGTLITPEVADHLAQWVPFSIEISLYGRTSATHEEITRLPGSFERCMRGIQLLMDRKLPLKVKTVVMTVNSHEIWEMKRFVEEDLGLEFRFDGMVNPRIDCTQDPLAVRLDPEEIIRLDLLDPVRMAEWTRFACQFNGPSVSLRGCQDLYRCGGGKNSFAINPRGQMSLCLLSQKDTFDLSQGTFKEGWEGFLSQLRRKQLTRMTKCVMCEIQAMCGMCPANGELEQQDPEEPVDFLCRVAHLRSLAMGMPAPPHGNCEYCDGGSAHQELKSLAARLGQQTRRCGSRSVGAGSFTPVENRQKLVS